MTKTKVFACLPTYIIHEGVTCFRWAELCKDGAERRVLRYTAERYNEKYVDARQQPSGMTKTDVFDCLTTYIMHKEVTCFQWAELSKDGAERRVLRYTAERYNEKYVDARQLPSGMTDMDVLSA